MDVGTSSHFGGQGSPSMWGPMRMFGGAPRRMSYLGPRRAAPPYRGPESAVK